MKTHTLMRLSAAPAALLLSLAAGCAASDPADAGAAPALVQAPSKHNGSGVVLKYAAPKSIETGRAGLVQLEFSGIVARDGAQVELKPDNPELQVFVDGVAPTGPIALAAGETRRLEVQVASSVDGMQYLNVFTRQNGRSTAAAVPLRVGTGQPRSKPSGTASTTPSGEQVISMPAR